MIAQSRSTQHKRLDAVARIALGEVALVAEEWSADVDVVGVNPMHHVQLALMPGARHASGRFLDRWRPQRFAHLGPLFLFPAHETIHARSDVRVQRSVVCHLDPAAMSDWFDADFAWTDRRLEGSLDIASRAARAVLSRLGDELRDPGFGGEAMIELLVAQLGLELSRYFRSMEAQASTGGLAPWRLKLIDDRLAHDAGGATLAGLAAVCSLSVRHLARAFRVSRGRSLGDHIASCRIAQAQAMLAAGRPIKETAFAAGFSAPSNFATAFRRATGRTPGDYRRSIASRPGTAR